MTRVVVVGGGISGLAAAAGVARQRPDADVVLLEASDVVGGKLRGASLAGIQVDVGAEAVLARRAEAVDLIRSVGLGDDRIDPLTTTAALRAGGARHPMPARTMFGIPADVDAVRASGVLSSAAVDRIVREAGDDSAAPVDRDVAVGELVRARLGNEVADRLVEPLLGGIYAGRADALSLRATMSSLAARLASVGGSLVQAARAVTDVGSHDPTAGPVFTSLTGGLARLPAAVAAAGLFTVRTHTTVRSIRRTPTGFEVVCGPVPEQELLTADAVVIATPAAKAALLLRDVAPVAATGLAAVESASVAIVTLAFRDASPPPGSGLLIGIREGFGVKAVTLSSQKWPMPTGGLTVLRASLGRAGESRILQRDDDELVSLVRHELRALIGVDGPPVDALVTRWGGGLPQYAVGHVEAVARIRAAVAAVPGLAVCGATYDGVGIPACIASANAAAEVIVAGLARPA